jgi:hypothetical protein
VAHRARTFRTVAGDELRVEISRPEGRAPSVFFVAPPAVHALELSGDDVRAIGAFLGEEAATEWAPW